MDFPRQEAAGWRLASAALAALALLATLILAPFGPAGAQEDEPYRLRPGDVVQLSVIEDPGLNREVLVRPDGRITLPIVGSIEAAGRTPEAVAATVESRLAPSFEIRPTVSLALVGLAPEVPDEEELPPAAYVLGQVRNPGAVSLERPLTVLQALAVAGGFDRFAAPARIRIRRQGEAGAETFAFDYEAFEEGLESGLADFALQDGDVVVVPERGLFE